jgi:hypothetical protein
MRSRTLAGIALITMMNAVLAAPEAEQQKHGTASAEARQPKIRVIAMEEKTNAALNIFEAAAAALYTDNEIDTLWGQTTDFGGKALVVYATFKDEATKKRLWSLINLAGQLTGTVVCKRIRKGTTPDAPQLGVAVLAEDCTIKSLNH